MSKLPFSSVRQVYYKNKGMVTKWILLIPGKGCVWAKQTGGCSFCGFKDATDRYADLYKLPLIAIKLIFAVIYRLSKITLGTKDPINLVIFNGGSFLVDSEIPISLQNFILRIVAKDSQVVELTIESRPEFITEERIKQVKNILGNKKLTVNIGLECYSDKIRTSIIRKGFTRKTFEKAINILKDNGCGFVSYVFLKPLGLSEKQAMEEAVRTIIYSFSLGADSVELEPAMIMQGTEMHKEYLRRRYELPKLWSIISVLEKTFSFGNVFIASLEDDPPPIAIPNNCPLCSDRSYFALHDFNKTQDLATLLSINCGCKIRWKDMIKTKKKKSKTIQQKIIL